LDTALLERPGNKDIQLDLFLDCASNVKLYPAFQDYFRKATPSLLAIWGRNDDAMVAIERDNKSLKRVLPKEFARTALDKQRLGEMIDLGVQHALNSGRARRRLVKTRSAGGRGRA